MRDQPKELDGKKAGLHAAGRGIAPERAPYVDLHGTVALSHVRLPFSQYGSRQARATFLSGLRPAPAAIANDLLALRRFYTAFNDELLARMREFYAVDVEELQIGGVPAHRVTPRGREVDQSRVLLNLHGGAFMWGSGSGALVEAIPIAVSAGSPVIAIDYRLAPEHVFPAAVDDVQSVYEALLQSTSAHSIAMYGCSAGAILTAQCVARFIERGLPVPGAVAMLGGAGLMPDGDSVHLASALSGEPAAVAINDKQASIPVLDVYLNGVSGDDPRVAPGTDANLLARFPPSLLITGTRDFALSSVSTMHRRLSASGVRADMFVFDGMWHAFHIFPDMPESQEVYALLADFFRRNLAAQPSTRA
jgi:monoterpene epsilon-lactone hydrolase